MAEFVAGIVSGLLVGGALEGFRLFRVARQRPALTLDIVPELMPDRIADHPCAYARLAVSNAKGRDIASGVSVRIDRAAKSEKEASSNLAFLATRPLAWADADRGKPNVNPGVNPVPPGDRRLIDIAHLNASVERKFIVDVRPQPGNQMNYLGAGRFTFTLVVSADNADARCYTVDVVHDGLLWEGDQNSAPDRLRLENLHRA
jgi:hypothetical protein